MEFLPEAKIGKIQQDTVDIEGKDLVLAMVQSLSMKVTMKEHLIRLDWLYLTVVII